MANLKINKSSTVSAVALAKILGIEKPEFAKLDKSGKFAKAGKHEYLLLSSLETFAHSPSITVQNDVETLVVGTDQLARALAVSPRRIQQLVKSGVFEKVGRGKYRLVDALSAYIEKLQSTSGSTAELPADLLAERAKLTREQRIGQEFKNKQIAGEWAPIGQLEVAISRTMAEISRHLEGARPALRRLADGVGEKYKEHSGIEADMRALIDKADETLNRAQNIAAEAHLDHTGIPDDSDEID